MYNIVVWAIATSICFVAAIYGGGVSVNLWKRRTEANWRIRITVVIMVTILMFGGTLNSFLHLIQEMKH